VVVQAHLVGRANEIERIDEALHNVSGGAGRLLCLVGDAGIGKTSLLHHAQRRLADLGATVRTAQVAEPDRRRHLIVARRWYPTMALEHLDPIDAVIAEIERDVAQRPTALLVDDLHWADPASGDLVTTIGQLAATLGTLVLVAMRPASTENSIHRLSMAVDGTVLNVGPLAEADVERLATRHSGSRIDDATRQRLRLAHGNPFLALALLEDHLTSSVAAEGAEAGDARAMSAELARRLGRRTLTAVPGSELVLTALASIPGGAAADEISDVLDIPFSQALDVVQRCAQAGLLIESTFGVSFRHDLLRDAVVQSTPVSSLRALSRRFGEILIARRSAPERIASCLLLLPDPQDPHALQLCVDVAHACWRERPEVAADLYRWALTSAEHEPVPRQRHLEDLGWALVAAGRASEVGPLIEHHVGPFNLEEPVGLQRLRGTAAVLAGRIDEVAANYASVDWRDLAGRYDPTDPEAVDAIAELAQLRANTGAVVEAEEIADWVDAAPAPPTALRSVTIASARALVEIATGRFDEGLVSARRAAAFHRAAGDELAGYASTQILLAMALDHHGEGDAALAASRHVPVARTPRWTQPLLQSFAALALYRRGDWDDSLAEVDAAVAAAADVDAGLGAYWPPSIGALIATARGNLRNAECWLRRAQLDGCRLAIGREWMALATVELCDAQGRGNDAAALASFTVDRIFETGCIGLLVNGGPTLAAHCLRSAPHGDRAQRVAEALASISAASSSPVATAHAEWAAGIVNADARAVEGAAQRLDTVGRVPEAARAFAAAAELAVLNNDAQATGRRCAGEALARFDRLEAAGWARSLRRVMSGSGVIVRRGSTRRPQNGWESLSPSEATIVSLVGEGLTNSQIAARLIVSRRTVESHLVRVYTKLQLTSRPQLAAIAAVRNATPGV
jgi:DNA-binding CsgD family transcriptional regulator/tetratricopeptide (TPR) repeat protein